MYTLSQGRRNLGCLRRWAILEDSKWGRESAVNTLGLRCWGVWRAAGSRLIGLQLSRGWLEALAGKQREVLEVDAKAQAEGTVREAGGARTDSEVDRGDGTGIRLGRTQKGRKRCQRYRSEGREGWGSLGGNGQKMGSSEARQKVWSLATRVAVTGWWQS